MRKFYGSLILVIVLSHVQPAFSQLKDKFIKATILLQNGKIIEGFIHDDQIAVMNYNISFKAAETENKLTIYDTSNAKNITLENGEIYELIHYKGNFMTSEVSVLAKLIVRGKASLYQAFYKDDEIYIITNNGMSYPLQNDKLEQGASELTLYNYKLFLNNALFDAPVSKSKIENASFRDKDFISLVTDYNKAVNAENKIITSKRKPVHYIIASAGGMIRSSEEKEVSLQGIYRRYLPTLSHSASLNIGINYFNYHYRGLNKYNISKNLINTLISLPVQIQQNFLNKNVRPYAFAGFNFSYVKQVDDKGVTQLDKGLQQSIGVGMLYGTGIEADIYKGVMLKSEYRYENFAHLIMAGIGYNFSK